MIIKAKLRDRAEEIIKNVIRHKETVLDAIGSYSVNAYIKAFQLDSSQVKQVKDGDSITRDGNRRSEAQTRNIPIKPIR